MDENGSRAGEADAVVEDAYWRENYGSRPYVKPGIRYEAFQAAYRLGWEGTRRYAELEWEQAEPRLQEDWRRTAIGGRLEWDKASQAMKDAWDRLRGDPQGGQS